MSGIEELKIGKKAEIYITKKIREKIAKALEEATKTPEKPNSPSNTEKNRNKTNIKNLHVIQKIKI